MSAKEYYQKVDLLRAGQVVEIEGNWFTAKRISNTDGWLDCFYCSVASICKGDIPSICIELETPSNPHWILELVNS